MLILLVIRHTLGDMALVLFVFGLLVFHLLYRWRTGHWFDDPQAGSK